MKRNLKYLVVAVVLGLVAGVAGAAEMIVHLPLDEGTGSTVYDYSGNDLTGAIYDTVNWLVDGGISGSALEFNPSGSDTTGRIEVVYNNPVGFDGVSLTCWVKNYGQTTWGRLWHGTSNWCMEIGTDDALWWWDPTAGDIASSLAVPQDDQYHFIGITADDAAVTFYLDDQVQVFASSVARQWTDDGAWFGGVPELGFGPRPLHGAMDDIRLFNGALTSLEVAAIKQGLFQAHSPNPPHKATGVDPNLTQISWSNPEPRVPGDTITVDVLFGTDETMVTAVKIVDKQPVESASVSLDMDETYYWRVDCYDPATPDPELKTEGLIWRFSTPLYAASYPDPENGETDVSINKVLSWTAGIGATSHKVYISTDEAAVTNRTAPMTEEVTTSHDPDPLQLSTDYFWAVDEVNAGGTEPGPLWQFATTEPDVVVDFASQIGPATHRFSGFLCHAIWPDCPPDELVDPLKPGMIQAGANWVRLDEHPGLFAPGFYERIHDRLGMTIQIRIYTSYALHYLKHHYSADPNWNDPAREEIWPGDDDDWTNWENYLTELVTRVLQHGFIVIYDIWNEPNTGFWPKGYDKYLELWRRGWLKIKEVDPTAKTMGPSINYYSYSWITNWLLWAKANNVLPDILCWHEFDSNGEAIPAHVAEMKVWMADNDIAIDQITISEIIPQTRKYTPAAPATYFANLERTDVVNAARSCWPADSEEIWRDYIGCHYCRLNNMITYETMQPRSIWWAYKAYADVTGTLVNVARADGVKVDGVAGYDMENNNAGAFLGRYDYGASAAGIAVAFSNIDNSDYLIDDGKVRVVAQHIPNTGFVPLDSPVLVIDAEYTIADNQLTIELPDFAGGDAYFVQLVNPGCYALAGDLNGDYKVNVDDLVILVGSWLDSGTDLASFAVLASDWLICD